MQTAAATCEKKKQILIVEDESLIAMDMQRQLERLGYSVPEIASSGEQALELAHKVDFDLVLMDIHLHGSMDGIAAADILRHEFQKPVVYITAHSDPETLERAKVTGPLGYILKPVGADSLRATIEVSLYKHEMEHLLLVSEAWHWTTLRSIGEGIIATDPRGRIVLMNPVAEQLTGWANEDAGGHPLMEVLSLCEEDKGRLITSPVHKPGRENHVCLLISNKGVKTPVEISSFENHTNEEVLGTILIVRDISVRRKMEARMTQAERMEAIAAMASGLAHDFNNLLTIIQGYAQQLSSNRSTADHEAVEQIQQAAYMATRISQQLLVLGRNPTGQPALADLNRLVCEIQPLLSFTLGKPITLATNLGPTEDLVCIDANLFKQALINMALNARDAMPDGGEFRIESSVVDIDPDCPAAAQRRPGRYVLLQMTDTGAGMDEATLPHIFEPFFTTRPGAGTGLGLSVVHSTVVQSGGYISAESRPGAGTTFEILLPCVTTLRRLAKNLAQSHAGDRKRTVLIVEDDERMRNAMCQELAGKGYQLLEAGGAGKAEQIAAFHDDPLDFLVTEVTLPGTTGIQLAERLHLLRPEMKTLLFSRCRRDPFQAAA